MKLFKFTSLIVLLTALTLGFTSCDKDGNDIGDKNAPVVNTKEVHTITTNSALAGGIITDEGESAITKKGLCWGKQPSPTISGLHSDHGGGPSTFDSQMANLQGQTKYYYRAYATNADGTGYGEEKSFTTN